MVKNMVKDLTEAQRNIILEPASDSLPARGYVGQTLDFFIEDNLMENQSIAALYEELEAYRLKWPFRTLYVTVEVTKSAGFTLPVIDDDTLEQYAKGDLGLSDLDPQFKIEDAYDEVSTSDQYYANCDYAVEDDTGRRLIDWDD